MKKPQHTPSPASVFMQQTPFNEADYLLKAQGFLEASPSATVKMALTIINIRPASWRAWVLMFRGAQAICAKKKPYLWLEWLAGHTKKIHTLQEGARVIQHHPTNRWLWAKVLVIAQIQEDRALEEMILRIMLDCDHKDPASLSRLADFLYAKAKILAKGPKQTKAFQEAALLIGMAIVKRPHDQGLRKKQIDVFASAATHVGGWEEVHQQGGTYRSVMAAFENPESVGWKLPGRRQEEE